MKEGCLICLYLWDPWNWDASDCVLGVFGKLSIRRGAWAWFNDIWTCGAKVLEYWMISSLKIKLNRSWKFRRMNWNVPLVLLERSWWAGFNGIYLVRFGFRMWEILIQRWFLPLKIQINSKKTRLGKEKSVEDVVTLGPTAQATQALIKALWFTKLSILWKNWGPNPFCWAKRACLSFRHLSFILLGHILNIVGAALNDEIWPALCL
jgi:hypothetical protein